MAATRKSPTGRARSRRRAARRGGRGLPARAAAARARGASTTACAGWGSRAVRSTCCASAHLPPRARLAAGGEADGAELDRRQRRRDAGGAADDAARGVGDGHEGARRPPDVALIKFYGAKVLHDVVDRAVQVHGSLGYSTDLPLEQMYRFARAARIYDGPDEVHRQSVARHVLRGYAPPPDGVPERTPADAPRALARALRRPARGRHRQRLVRRSRLRRWPPTPGGPGRVRPAVLRELPLRRSRARRGRTRDPSIRARRVDRLRRGVRPARRPARYRPPSGHGSIRCSRCCTGPPASATTRRRCPPQSVARRARRRPPWPAARGALLRGARRARLHKRAFRAPAAALSAGGPVDPGGRGRASAGEERRVLVPIGGGKDSAVALEIVRRSGLEMALFSIGDAPPILRTVAAAGLPHLLLAAARPGLTRLNRAGAINGHVPDHRDRLLRGAADGRAARLRRRRDRQRALGLRRQPRAGTASRSTTSSARASAPSGCWRGARRGCPALRALLRPAPGVGALDRARVRAHGALPPAFTSCNAIFRSDPALRAASWCCDCPKCRFVFLALAPFIDPAQLRAIFGA